MGHLFKHFKRYQVIVLKMKNPVNIEVYGVLVELDALKVLEAGIEPALPKKLDFESSASTSSATRASGWQKYEFFPFCKFYFPFSLSFDIIFCKNFSDRETDSTQRSLRINF